MPKPTRTPERISLPGGYCIGALNVMGEHGLYADLNFNLMIGSVETEHVQSFAAAMQSPAGEWRPIATAPKDGTMLLLWDGQSIRIGQFHHNPDIEWTTGFAGNGWPLIFPEAWMPLPRAPTGEG